MINRGVFLLVSAGMISSGMVCAQSINTEAVSAECSPRVVVVPMTTKKGSVTPEYVLEGETFSSESGVEIMGTMPNNSAESFYPGEFDQPIPKGYYNGSGIISGDADLKSENIRAGVTVFGVTGSSTVVNTSSGDATASDILAGKKVWVDGQEVIGALRNPHENGEACIDHSECQSGYCDPDRGSTCSAAFRRVFVTSTTYTAALGGASDVDRRCNEVAGNDPRTRGRFFMAWIAGGRIPSPASRFSKSGVPYVLVDGTVIANNWSDLTDGTLDSPIQLNEKGELVDSGVWTNATGAGEVADTYYTCSNWSSQSNSSLPPWYGSTTSTSGNWTRGGKGGTCRNLLHLYCFEQ